MMWHWGSKPKVTFRIKITCEITGYSGDERRQWCVEARNRQGRSMSFGMGLVGETSVEAAMREACSSLSRMGAVYRP